MARYGMVIDLVQCIGCSACSLACKVEYGTPVGVFYHRVLQKEVGKWPNANREYLPLLCFHCDNAPCVEVCPTKAAYKRDDGIVAMDYDKCMGCGYCIIACPYGARTKIKELKGYFEPEYGLTPYEEMMYKKHQIGVAEKCNFCTELVEKGEDPVCVQTCPAYARFFGDLDDPESEVSMLIAERSGYTLLPEQGCKPSVYYISPSRGSR